MDKAQQAQDMIRAVYEEGIAEINGREYRITSLTHKKRRKVFAYFTHVQADLQRQDFSFLDSERWAAVEAVIENVVTFEDALLSKSSDHWEKYPGDYLIFVSTMLGAISYPFLSGISGG
ncbi:MAG: hypothetical protein P1P89_19735 [Desulfobacterales bacterium]|nr:hypothetical protein [Desulfobacterales bacterium]